jgi:hypothetical protein
MANPEKHGKNPVREWFEGEEGTVPANPRSSHLVGSYIKGSKPLRKKSRPLMAARAQSQTPSKPDPALLREPSPPPKAIAKQSQTASWEHQKKLERLPNLRAPYQYKNR